MATSTDEYNASLERDQGEAGLHANRNWEEEKVSLYL